MTRAGISFPVRSSRPAAETVAEPAAATRGQGCDRWREHAAAHERPARPAATCRTHLLDRFVEADGHATQVGVLLRQALEMFQRIGAAEAPDLLAELDTLTGPRPVQ